MCIQWNNIFETYSTNKKLQWNYFKLQKTEHPLTHDPVSSSLCTLYTVSRSKHSLLKITPIKTSQTVTLFLTLFVLCILFLDPNTLYSNLPQLKPLSNLGPVSSFLCSLYTVSRSKHTLSTQNYPQLTPLSIDYVLYQWVFCSSCVSCKLNVLLQSMSQIRVVWTWLINKLVGTIKVCLFYNRQRTH